MSQASGDHHSADDGSQLREKHTLVLFVAPVLLLTPCYANSKPSSSSPKQGETFLGLFPEYF